MGRMPAQTVTSAVFGGAQDLTGQCRCSLSEHVGGQTGVVGFSGSTRLPITMSRETLCSPSVIVLTVSRRLYGTRDCFGTGSRRVERG